MILYLVALGPHDFIIDGRLAAPGGLEIGTLHELQERLISGIGTAVIMVGFSGSLLLPHSKNHRNSSH